MRTWIVWLLLMAAVLAEPTSEIRKALPMKCFLRSIKSSGDYALATVRYAGGEGGGQVLLRKVDGCWRELASGGGAMNTSNLFVHGVPRQHWKALVASESPPEDEAEPGWPETATRKLTPEDLSNRSAWELTLMRNEIFARHGREFKDPLLREYFTSRPWYHPNHNFQPDSLTPVEKQNATAIQVFQDKSGKNF